MRLLKMCFVRRQPTDLTKSGAPLSSCATAPPRTEPMVTGSQRPACKPPPVRLTPDERKIVLAELHSLEDVRVRAFSRCHAPLRL